MNDLNSINKPLVNRVAESGLKTIDLERFYPEQEIVGLDIKEFLFKGLLLKEKDFKEHIANHHWEQYQDKIVAVHCSTDAILQQWAFMLIIKSLFPFTQEVYQGSITQVKHLILINEIRSLEVKEFNDARVMVKGCSGDALPDAAYLEITKRLLPVVKSLMFGEACSNVPVFKKPMV